MERPVMFLQSLLVLVVTIQVISACECGRITIEDAMRKSEIVVKASVLSAELVNLAGHPVHVGAAYAYIKYNMFMDAMYKGGPKLVVESQNFTMMSPRHHELCGAVLRMDYDYYLSGSVDELGHLFITECDLIFLIDYREYSEDDLKEINDILTGNHKPVCRGV